ncbi:MAG: DEAD/DEAH box helicase [candidate division KSB1 bacterium]|nr:DEAD/DEAH box helicase [candidate division KSB1 bacterium]
MNMILDIDRSKFFKIFNKGNIRALARDVIYNRGRRYFLNDRVNILSIDESRVRAEVIGQMIYSVNINFTDSGTEYFCDCPYPGFCKHLVATMLKVELLLHQLPQPAEKPKRARVRRLSNWEDFILRIQNVQQQETDQHKWVLVFRLKVSKMLATLSVEKAYIRKDGSLGRRNHFSLDNWAGESVRVTANEKLVLGYFLAQSEWNAHRNRYRYYYTSDIDKIHFSLGDECGFLFSLLRDSIIELDTSNYLYRPLHFAREKGRILFRVEKSRSGLICRPFLRFADEEEPLGEAHFVLTSKPVWILRDDQLIEIENMHNGRALHSFTLPNFSLTIPQKDFIKFLRSISPLEDISQNLQVPESLSLEETKLPPKPRLYLNEHGETLKIELKFAYGDHEIVPQSPSPHLFAAAEHNQHILKIPRDFDKEAHFRNRLLKSGVTEIDANSFMPAADDILDWLLAKIPELAQHGFEIYGEEKLSKLRVRRARPQTQIVVSSGIDWFDLQLVVDVEGLKVSLAEIQKALEENRRFIKLADGSFVKIPESWLRQFNHLLKIGERADDNTLRLSRVHASLIDTLAEQVDEMHADPEFMRMLDRLRHFEGIAEIAPPKGLRGELREYQRAGLNWLVFLQEFRFGGCLADDMGLGKTIQALALLLHEKERGNTLPSLVVVPKSLVFNWQREAERFTPELKIHVQTGPDRTRDAVAFEGHDIVLTTYGTLRRDIGFLREVQFHYVILDESQNIKNPASQTAKAARLLRANHRLALTGTPVENNTLELWSLMTFLNPGMLGNRRYFQSAFATPIERKGDVETARFLHRLVYPFILRRTKDQVEKDLPPKTETVIYTSMEPEQEKLYNTWRDFYRAAILKEIDQKGLNQSRMKVLEGLMKLRQIACHPALIEPNTDRPSGKFTALIEHIEEILSEGHKILLFSQFVKMLTIIRNHLDKAGIPYEYLDGRTRDREARVRNFQENDAIKLFLISLRAGGTGLNLTAADYVIHYDPWWNPAVEAQASDRSHRIGQEKHVFVYKFIARNTVEEKVLQLQERKRDLVEKLITTDRAFFKQLSKQDIETLFS